jgi:hypothetical protein
MPDKIVTLAMYHDPMEAQLVRNRLEAEGIPAFLSGDETSNLFGGMSGAFGTVHLQVAEENLERAADLLEADDKLMDEQDPSESTAIRVRDTMTAAPEPEKEVSARPPAKPRSSDITAKRASAARPDVDEDAEDRPRLARGADDYADRAWRASVLGLFFFPVQLYSIWLLFRLLSINEDLGPAGLRKLYGALFFNGVGIACILYLVAYYRVLGGG